MTAIKCNWVSTPIAHPAYETEQIIWNPTKSQTLYIISLCGPPHTRLLFGERLVFIRIKKNEIWTECTSNALPGEYQMVASVIMFSGRGGTKVWISLSWGKLWLVFSTTHEERPEYRVSKLVPQRKGVGRGHLSAQVPEVAGDWLHLAVNRANRILRRFGNRWGKLKLPPWNRNATSQKKVV